MSNDKELQIFSLGTGINTLKDDKPLGSVEGYGIKVPSYGDHPKPVSGRYYCHSHVFETHVHQKKQFELGLNVTAVTPPVDGALSLDYRHMKFSDEDTLYGFFSCYFYLYSEELKQLNIPKDILKKGLTGTDEQKKDFFRIYGNACVTKVDYGKRVHAVLRFSNLKKGQTSAVAAELQVKLNQIASAANAAADASGALKFKADSNLLSNYGDVEVELFVVGTAHPSRKIKYRDFHSMFNDITELMDEDSEPLPIEHHYQPYPLANLAPPSFLEERREALFSPQFRNVANAEYLLKKIGRVISEMNFWRINKMDEIKRNGGIAAYEGEQNYGVACAALDQLQGRLRGFIEDIMVESALLSDNKRPEWEARIEALKQELVAFFGVTTDWLDFIEKRIGKVVVPKNKTKSQEFKLPRDLPDEKFVGFHVTQEHPNPEEITFSIKKVINPLANTFSPTMVGYPGMKSGVQLSVRDFAIERTPAKKESSFLLEGIKKNNEPFGIIITEADKDKGLRQKIWNRPSPPPSPISAAAPFRMFGGVPPESPRAVEPAHQLPAPSSLQEERRTSPRRKVVNTKQERSEEAKVEHQSSSKKAKK